MKMIIFATLLFVPTLALANNTDNQKQVDVITDYLMANRPQTASLSQTGKTEDGQICTLEVSKTRFGITLVLRTAKLQIDFRASDSSKVSRNLEIVDTDENLVEADQVVVSQIATGYDEYGPIAIREHVRVLTNEDQGSKDNVAAITISAQSTLNFNKTHQPDFSKAAPMASVACSFGK